MKPSRKASDLIRPECQFSGEACSTQSNHYRKVISHIFGRNKKCTIRVPHYVWIYYCRKHYQRARYRTGEWPFRQCDLAVDTIRNMRAWGGVESFNLQLRRREAQRTSSGNTVVNGCGNVAAGASKNQSSIHVPVDSTTFTSVNRPQHTSRAIKREILDSDDEMAESPDSAYEDVASLDLKKRSPTIVPHPVPDWLHDRVGDKKSFDDILEVLADLKDHLYDISENGGIPHFPDIEILPNLRGRASGSSKAGAKGRISKVASRRGVRKPSK